VNVDAHSLKPSLVKASVAKSKVVKRCGKVDGGRRWQKVLVHESLVTYGKKPERKL